MSEVIDGTTVERAYAVTAGILVLTIVVGEGQIGASIVWLDDQLIAKGDLGIITLGPGSVLSGRVLGIRSIVADVNPHTDRTAVTYLLTGGADEMNVTLTQNAATANSTVAYAARFPLA